MIDPISSANGPYVTANAYNQRMPDLQLPCDYPYVHFYQFRDGSWDRRCVESGFESKSHGHISGSFEETDYLGSKKSLHVGRKHEYVVGGKTETSEGNHDEKIGGSHVSYITQDSYHEHGGDHMTAVGADTIHASKGSHDIFPTGQLTMGTTGDTTSDTNDGGEYKNIQSHDIKFIGGTKYQYVGGEHGLYVANGNSDTNVSLNLNLQSGKQITIKVGSSIVTINGTSITLNDGNNNEVGMNGSKVWIGPSNPSTPLYLGGNGQNAGLYSKVSTLNGPSINVYAKVSPGQG
jgi:hypothetical protein